MKRFIFFIILTLTALLMQAQTNVSLTYDLQSDKSGVKEYAKEVGVFFARPEVKTDNKKTTAVWHETNMDWVKDYCDVKNVAIEKDYSAELATDGREQRDGASLLFPYASRRSEQPVSCLRRDKSC